MRPRPRRSRGSAAPEIRTGNRNRNCRLENSQLRYSTWCSLFVPPLSFGSDRDVHVSSVLDRILESLVELRVQRLFEPFPPVGVERLAHEPPLSGSLSGL